MDDKISVAQQKLLEKARALKFPLPARCIACGGETFIIQGFKTRQDSKYGDNIIGVLVYCNGKCKKFVAECLGSTTTWYVDRGEIIGAK